MTSHLAPRTAGAAVAVLSIFCALPVSAQSDGVTLYDATRFRGESVTLDRDERDLDDTPVGARHARSVRVPPGCTVTLFDRRDFRGRSVVLDRDMEDLGRTELGRDRAVSVHVRCEEAGWGQEGRPDRPGVTLFRGRRLSGTYETFVRDVPDLGDTDIGSGTASSIHVSPGCLAVLYDRPWYRGRSTEFREADNDLSNTPVGDDSAASLRVRCAGMEPEVPVDEFPRYDGRHGATLFRDSHLRGPWQTFSRDVADLARTDIGAGTASSIALRGGCTATLYEGRGFTGRSTTFREDDKDLSNTPVGEDRAASIRVSCPGDAPSVSIGGGPGPGDEGPGVTLFRDRKKTGPSETFRSDVRDLRRTRIGAGTASSIAVAPGCVAVLYDQPDFAGRSTEFRDDDNNLANTPVGEDRAASLRVRCGR